MINVKDKIRKSGYTMTAGWMISDLGLGGYDLILYSLIYSFTRQYGAFTGSRAYMAQWAGCALSTVDKTVDNLVKKGYVEKQKAERRGIDHAVIRAKEDVYTAAAEAAGFFIKENGKTAPQDGEGVPDSRVSPARDTVRGTPTDGDHKNINKNNNYNQFGKAPAGAYGAKQGKRGYGGRDSGGNWAKPREFSSFDTEEFWKDALRHTFGDDAGV